jgi:hypothetical protein
MIVVFRILRTRRCGGDNGLGRLRGSNSDLEAPRLLGVIGTIHRPVFRPQFRLHAMQMTNCRLDSANGEGASTADYPGFFCLPCRFG